MAGQTAEAVSYPLGLGLLALGRLGLRTARRVRHCLSVVLLLPFCCASAAFQLCFCYLASAKTVPARAVSPKLPCQRDDPPCLIYLHLISLVALPFCCAFTVWPQGGRRAFLFDNSAFRLQNTAFSQGAATPTSNRPGTSYGSPSEKWPESPQMLLPGRLKHCLSFLRRPPLVAQPLGCHSVSSGHHVAAADASSSPPS